MDTAGIRSLIKLLDDESEEIVSTVKEKLLESGSASIPSLEEAMATGSPVLRERLRSVVIELTTAQVRIQLEELRLGEAADLDIEAGALVVARYGYPSEDLKWCSKVFDEFAQELDSRLDTHDDPLDIISAVSSFLSFEGGFKGDIEDYYNPENSYINRVLERRTGLPISLCIIYLLVAKRLNIPLFGVGMPGHFLLKYEVGEKEIFLDPFRGAKLLSRTDCRDFIEATGYGFREEYFSTVTNRQILERMIRNLMLAYRQKGELDRIPNLQSFLEILGRPKLG
ncbi:MAG: transglutaminase-like domain-containing protein [Bacteroidota bacterium]